MATNGVLSMVKNGQVEVKIIVGCNGFNVDDLSETVTLEMTEHDLEDAAINVDFGCDDCRVIMMRENISGHPPHYQADFHNPKINPRWLSRHVSYHTVVKEF